MTKSLRLNKSLRDSILKSIMNKYEEANPLPESELPTSVDLKVDLAEKIHKKVYGKYSINIPIDMVNTSNHIKVQYPNQSVVQLYFKYDENKGYDYKISTKQSKVEYVLSEDDPLWLDFIAIKNKIDEFNNIIKGLVKDKKSYEEGVSQVLEGVNTTGQLLEQWPEVEDYLPQNISNPSKINLPSVSVSKLNEKLK
jgi:hypothetical protein